MDICILLAEKMYCNFFIFRNIFSGNLDLVNSPGNSHGHFVCKSVLAFLFLPHFFF